jgi:hypothetical protein
MLGIAGAEQAGSIAGETARVAAEFKPKEIKAGLQAAEAAASAATTGGLLQLGGTLLAVGAVAFSDEHVKENIRSVESSDEFEEFLNAISAKTYDYKEEFKEDARAPGGEGKHLGIIAQDLEDSELGREMLVKGSDGILGFDIRRATSISLGGLAHLNERIKKLEAEVN